MKQYVYAQMSPVTLLISSFLTEKLLKFTSIIVDAFSLTLDCILIK